MIQAVFTRQKDGGAITAFAIEGHANQGPYGEDLVCGAVSALSQATVIGLEEVAGLPVKVEQRSGLLRCVLPGEVSSRQRAAATVLLETLLLSLTSLEQNYGDALQVKVQSPQGGGMDAGH